MNQHTQTQSLRLPLFALLLTLISAIGFFTVRVYAQEEMSAQGVEVGTSAQERRNIFEEQKMERREAFEQAREESEALSAEEREQVRTTVRGTTEGVRTEHQERSDELRSEQGGDTQTMRREHAQAMRVELATRKEERLQRKTEYRAKLGLAVQARVGQYVERVSTRMNVAIERLEQIASRINERIVVLEEEGRDMSDARAELDEVHVLLDDSREFVILFGDVSTDALTSETPSEQAQKVRDATKLAKDAIVEVHRALSETVQLIRATPLQDEEVVSKDEGGEVESTEEPTEEGDDMTSE